MLVRFETKSQAPVTMFGAVAVTLIRGGVSWRQDPFTAIVVADLRGDRRETAAIEVAPIKAVVATT